MGDFHFQAPGARRFLEQVSAAALSAEEGLGVFAFASARGVDSFMSAIALGAKSKPPRKFHLIVGVDAITNADALLRITDYVDGSKGALTAEIFWHDNPASTFHPKFAIFRNTSRLLFLTGSGNLTTRGLGEASDAPNPPGNWEAFMVQEFTGLQAEAHWSDAQAWMSAERAAGRLRPLTDEAVKSRAMINGMLRFIAIKSPATVSAVKGGVGNKSNVVPGGTTGVTTVPKWSARDTLAPGAPAVSSAHPKSASALTVTTPSEVTALDAITVSDDLLIKELPRNRPGQADVGKENLEVFFGYIDGKSTDILVQYVSLSDVVEATETIRLFENASSNYRLELRAIAGFNYDIGKNDERIIVVVARLAPRSFRYTVVPVTSPHYSVVSGLLGPISKANRRMRGKRLALKDLALLWPAAPGNLKPIIAHGLTP